jgi:hypothetical protein
MAEVQALQAAEAAEQHFEAVGRGPTTPLRSLCFTSTTLSPRKAPSQGRPLTTIRS